MKNWVQTIQSKYLKGSIVEKIIFINIAIFLGVYLFNTLFFLFKIDTNFIINWFALPANFELWISKPWSLLSYGFLHQSFFHILFNMLFLYYIGNLFLDFFSQKQFLTYYILGIITGGIMYLLSYNYLPALKIQQSILVGASAGVMAILVGIASHIPQYALQFRFIGSIKLMHIALFFIVLDVIQIPIGNTGGHLAHLGGALLGYLLTARFKQGSSFIINIENLFKPKKQNPLKTVYKNKKETQNTNTTSQQVKIDRILDKISKSGYETLTKEEKNFLFKIGKN